LARKEDLVRRELKDLPVQSFRSILASPQQRFHRNKMEYSFGDDRDLKILGMPPAPESTVHLGLHPKKRFGVVTPTPECFLLSPETQIIIKVVSDWATHFKIPVYVRHRNEGVLRHLVIREGKNTGDRMVNLVATSAVTNIPELADLLKNSGVKITTFISTVHDGLSDIAQGDRQDVLWGEGIIHERIGNIDIRVSPKTFMQTNTHAAERMIDLLKAEIGVGDTLLDLYCGTGALGLSLSGQFIQVIGVELEAASVESAKATALQNGIINFTAIQGRVEGLLNVFQENRGRVDACVVDPPRAGLMVGVVKALVDSLIPTIFYISCNPESLARDLKGLSEAYKIETVQPVDFFPHTDHVETMVRLNLFRR
jgi:23S rRNA (uracil1939-C5)-methyltransferase